MNGQVPFNQAERYRSTGWTNTVPLPAKRKDPPPAGFTGGDGAAVVADDLARWRQDGWQDRAGHHHLPGNLALRLPPTIVGIDVDAYAGKRGAATLADREAAWGLLPPTWWSTSRTDGVSGIRLYQVPAVVGWPGQAGPDIELVHHGHRYAVVWPSVHPDGRPYRWVRPDGTDADPGALPTLGALPDLPAGWLAGLGVCTPTGQRPATPRTRQHPGAGYTWLTGLPVGPPCGYVAKLEARALAAARRLHGAAHDHTRDAVGVLLRAGEAGHLGVAAALDTTRQAFVATVADRASQAEAEAEFARMVDGGIGLIHAQPGQRAGRGCDTGCYDPQTINTQLYELAGRAGPPPADVDETTGEILNGQPSTGPAGGAAAPAGSGPRPNPLLGRLLDLDGLANLPQPEPLIHDVLDLRTVTVLAGGWGTGKTLIALDWACCIATGKPWQAQPVERPGRVLYLAAEGAYGLHQRIAAWQHAWRHPIAPDQIEVLPDPVQLVDRTAVGYLVDLVATHRHRLVVVDTVSRCMTGADENSAQHMSLVVEAADRLRKATDDTTVLLIHHTGKDGITVRGSSALESGADVIYQTAGDERLLQLRRTKRKDGPRDRLATLRLTPALDSVVVESVSPLERPATQLTTSDAKVLDTLRTTFGGHGTGVATLRDATGQPRSSVYAAVRRLLAHGLVRTVGGPGRTLYEPVPDIQIEISA